MLMQMATARDGWDTKEACWEAGGRIELGCRGEGVQA